MPDKLPDLNCPVRDIARRDYVRLLEDETIGEALTRLRSCDLGERIVYFYVTDAAGRLSGVVPTRRLLLSEPTRRVGEVMIHPVVSVQESDSIGQALESVMNRKLLALPVVDRDNRLAGVLDVTAFTQTLVDLERREAAEDVFQLVGVQVEFEKGRNLWRVLGSRFPWLLCNIASGLAAALIAQFFDHALRAVVAVAFFVPLVLTLAESIAMQSVTMSVQGVSVADRQGRVLREMSVGTALGITSGIIVAVLGIAWLKLVTLATVVASAIVIAGAIGAALGYFVPRLVHHWELDPKIASGPAVLALTDVATVTCYFGLAALLLT